MDVFDGQRHVTFQFVSSFAVNIMEHASDSRYNALRFGVCMATLESLCTYYSRRYVHVYSRWLQPTGNTTCSDILLAKRY